MNEHYTFTQAMDRLGLRSINAFLQLEIQYPNVFVNMNPSSKNGKNPWYDRAMVNEFAKTREHLKPEKP